MFRTLKRHQLTKIWIGFVPGGAGHGGDNTLVIKGSGFRRLIITSMREDILIFTDNILDMME